jgi:hypothetical protein
MVGLCFLRSVLSRLIPQYFDAQTFLIGLADSERKLKWQRNKPQNSADYGHRTRRNIAGWVDQHFCGMSAKAERLHRANYHLAASSG